MAEYPKLESLLHAVPSSGTRDILTELVIPYLVDIWLAEYTSRATRPDIVETTVDSFSYLFDVAAGRLIAAWGISRGRHDGARDKNRMRGHPLSAGPLYHRGHAIPHTLGGPTDINLVPQRGAINVGAFRELERKAVSRPGALYFSYWIYGDAATQTPEWVEQGLLVPGCKPETRRHSN